MFNCRFYSFMPVLLGSFLQRIKHQRSRFFFFKQNIEMVVVACCLHYHAAEIYILIYTPLLFQLSSLKVIDYTL